MVKAYLMYGYGIVKAYLLYGNSIVKAYLKYGKCKSDLTSLNVSIHQPCGLA